MAAEIVKRIMAEAGRSEQPAAKQTGPTARAERTGIPQPGHRELVEARRKSLGLTVLVNNGPIKPAPEKLGSPVLVTETGILKDPYSPPRVMTREEQYDIARTRKKLNYARHKQEEHAERAARARRSAEEEKSTQKAGRKPAEQEIKALPVTTTEFHEALAITTNSSASKKDQEQARLIIQQYREQQATDEYRRALEIIAHSTDDKARARALQVIEDYRATHPKELTKRDKAKVVGIVVGTGLVAAACAFGGGNATATPGETRTPIVEQSPSASPTASPTLEVTPSPTATAGFSETPSGIVWNGEKGEHLNVPDLSKYGLKAEIKDGKAIYIDAKGKYAGEFKPNVTVEQPDGTEKKTGIADLRGDIVADMTKQTYASGNFQFGLPVDVRGIDNKEECKIRFDKTPTGLPRIAITTTQEVVIVHFNPYNTGQRLLVKPNYSGPSNYVFFDPWSESHPDVTNVPAGKELNVIDVKGYDTDGGTTTDTAENIFTNTPQPVGKKVATVSAGTISITSSYDLKGKLSPAGILAVDGVFIAVASN